MSDTPSFAVDMGAQDPEGGTSRKGPAPLLLTALSEMTIPLTLVFLFSLVVNLLMLTGPLFMLQVYDRVLGSRSEETLLTLFGLVCFLYACLYALDSIRGRIMIRIAGRVRCQLEVPVLKAARAGETRPSNWSPPVALRELDSFQRLLGSPVALALFDLPWAPLYFGLLFVFHPLMGTLGLVATAVIVALAALKDYRTRTPLRDASAADAARITLAQDARETGTLQRILGVEPGRDARWLQQRDVALMHHVSADERAWTLSSATRTFRLFLQSAMLALGAHLVLIGELTSGAMIAGSILLGRALMPLEMIVGNLSTLRVSISGVREMEAQLARAPIGPDDEADLALPDRPVALEVSNLSYKAPESPRAILTRISFTLEPGTIMGITGRAGSGKSRLARLVVGDTAPTVGDVTLGGISVSRLPAETIARRIGFVPQFHTFFDGTLAENVTRFDPAATLDDAVVALARTGAMDEIARLPNSLHTDMNAAEQILTSAALQRIALARALFYDPDLLVVDEPSESLDRDTDVSVIDILNAHKARGKSVLVVTARLKLLQACDTLLVLNDGVATARGPRDKILRQLSAQAAATSQGSRATPPTAARIRQGD